MPTDYNEARAQRASSDRDLTIGPYTFRRVASAGPEVLVELNRPEGSNVDQEVIDKFDSTVLQLLEPVARLTATGAEIPAKEAWRIMRFAGDDYGVLSFADMGVIVTDLVSGLVERPTEQPSDSPGGSTTPLTGTSSTGTSPSEVPTSTLSTPAAPSTPSTPA